MGELCDKIGHITLIGVITMSKDIVADTISTIDASKVKDFEPFKNLLFDIYKACYMTYGQAKADAVIVDVIDLYKEAKGV